LSARRAGTSIRYDIDMLKVIRHARECGCFLELNARPGRLDLFDLHCQMAKGQDVLVATCGDAHSTQDFDNLYYRFGQPRLAGENGRAQPPLT
jgi:DNA polymerase (family 10)